MDYVECVHCGLTTLGAYRSSAVACRSTADHCGGCGAKLPHPGPGAISIACHPRFRAGRATGGPASDGTLGAA